MMRNDNTGGGGGGGGGPSHTPFGEDHTQWVRAQESHLHELRSALVVNPHRRSDEELKRLVDKSMDIFKEYMDRRKAMAEVDVLAVFCPSWCSRLENAFFWLGGCRPTMGIRLLYVLSGHELESRLEDMLRGVNKGDLCDINASQLCRINDLHVRTIKEEDRLSKRMALLQEEVADNPLVAISYRHDGLTTPEVDSAIEPYLKALRNIMLEAESLRMNTVRETLTILTPLQAVEYLAAVKQLHLSFHKWGVDKDTHVDAAPRNSLEAGSGSRRH